MTLCVIVCIRKNNYDDSFFYYITNKLLCSRGAADWSNIACARRAAVDDGGFGAGGGELEVVEATGDRDLAEEPSQFGSNEVADLESWQQMKVLDARQFQAHTRYFLHVFMACVHMWDKASSERSLLILASRLGTQP